MSRQGGNAATRRAYMAIRVATGTAVSAGGAAALAGAALVLVRMQGRMTLRTMGHVLGQLAPDADRTYKPALGHPVQLLLLGDSIAAGLGAGSPQHTPGARLARGIARRSGRAVTLRTEAVVGSGSAALPGQLAGLPTGYRPDIAVIITGGNDVAALVAPGRAAAHLTTVIEGLQELGAQVVLGTCPDLSVIPSIPQPLRAAGGVASRRMARVQARAGRDAGAVVVDLGRAVRLVFLADPVRMFAPDSFHPSSLGYKRSAEAMLEAVLSALEAGAGTGA